MTHVITEPCVGRKDASCVNACPVNAIHPTPSETDFNAVNQLYIDPLVCIDCGLCPSSCPYGAIFRDTDVPLPWQEYIQINADYFR